MQRIFGLPRRGVLWLAGGVVRLAEPIPVLRRMDKFPGFGQEG
jgi:hypothetical protein